MFLQNLDSLYSLLDSNSSLKVLWWRLCSELLHNLWLSKCPSNLNTFSMLFDHFTSDYISTACSDEITLEHIEIIPTTQVVDRSCLGSVVGADALDDEAN